MEEPRLFVCLAAEFDASQSISPPGGTRDQRRSPKLRPPRLSAHQHTRTSGDPSVQLEFQDSGLSPALSLLPSNSAEFSLLQNTSLDFAPLRAYPDFSVAYDKSQIPPQDQHVTSLASEPGTLSQHPLAMTTVATTTALTEEGGSSCCSLSQHSLSPGDDSRKNDLGGTQAYPPVPATTADGQEMCLREDTTRSLPPIGRVAGDRLDEPTEANSSAASSASETSVKMTSSLPRESKSTDGVPRSSAVSCAGRREHPPGGGAEESRQPARLAPTGERVPPELANITTGCRDTHPDDSSQALHRELLSEAELSQTSCEGRATRVETEGDSTQRAAPHTPLPVLVTGMSRGRPPGGILAGVLTTPGHPLSLGYGGVPGTRERDCWSSGNQFGIDGSYLGLLPQSQSTPGVFNAPARSSAKGPLGLQGSPSRMETSPDPGVSQPDTSTFRNVPLLPSLSFVEKVDAWRANQNVAGKPSLFDSLVLQGFAGMSPKKRAYDAISDSLNCILSQQVHPDSTPSNAPDQQQATTASSSPRRGEAVGSGPTSPLGHSRSHSSLSTVVTSVPPPVDPQPPDAPRRPSPLAEDGYRDNPRLLGASTGPSSVVSLEVDNYAPYWTSRPLTPPPPPPGVRRRELNIEERIPLYLHNLGIDQSPSTILTPFGPRGPIREPEFSPTDLLTIKGSVGTSTKSTQPSDGDSPHKGAFSRCSLLSPDSSVSIPLSMDSLCLATSYPDPPTVSPSPDQPPSDSQHPAVLHHPDTQTHGSHSSSSHASSSCSSDRHASVSHASDLHADDRNASISSANNRHAGVSHTSISHANVSRTSDSHVGAGRVTVRLSDRFEVSSSTVMETTAGDRKLLLSPLQASCSVRRTAADYPVGANTLPTQNLLGVSSSSSSSSSYMPMSRLHSDDDLLLSLRKRRGAAGFQDSTFTSWSGGVGALEGSSSFSSSPPLWARSSSDSMLTSERPGRRDVGPSPRQPDYPPSQPANQPTRQKEDSVSGPSQPSLLIAKTTRRAEPEGCSAAPPNNNNTTVPMAAMLAGPTMTATMSAGPTLAVTEPRTTPNAQPTPEPTEAPGVSEGEEPGSPAPSSSSPPSSLAAADPEQGVLSDGHSSDCSLATRVAKVLQSESSITMTTSTSSATTDQEDTRAREWIRLKVSGQQCESLELDAEDRRRIEEIKRELLLHRPLQNHLSTDTESSTMSSLGGRPLRPPVGPVADATLPAPPRQNLESRVREIAVREGVTLPRAAPPALTSITISTCRRSPSPSPAPPASPAPEPLRLTHLCADTGPPPPPSSSSRSGSGSSSSSSTANGERDLTGSQNDQLLPTSSLLGPRQEVAGTVTLGRDTPPPTPDRMSSVTGSSSPDALSSGGHISCLRLTLSPKRPEHRAHTAALAQDRALQAGLPSRQFSPLPCTTTTSSGSGLAEPCDIREPIRGRAPQRADTSTLFRTGLLSEDVRTSTTTAHPPQSFTPPQRLVAAHCPAPPVLLPYKPRGSEELFYVPQSEASVSPEHSGSTTESSHPGSDDAVPPRFSPEVLGKTDPGVDRGVSFRHTEGIYSKRLKTAGFTRQLVARTGAGSADTGSRPDTSSRVASGPLPSMHPSGFRRDQGTSPLRFLSNSQSEESGGEFRPMAFEIDRGTSTSQHADTHGSAPPSGLEGRRVQLQQTGGPLDQLWHRFSERRNLEEFRPTNEREASLLERLERLSRLIHGGGGGGGVVPGTGRGVSTSGPPAATEQVGRRSELTGGDGDPRWRVGREAKQTWTQEEETISPAYTHSSPCHGQRRFPAERDGSETPSTSSSFVSTVDTARLVRAFGSDRVRRSLTPGSPLGKLYHAIHKQREGGERRRERGEEEEQQRREGGGKTEDTPPVIPPSQSPGAESTGDSVSSASSYVLPDRRPGAQKTVRLVNRGVQAGELEIVSNATRRHTRDVGTTFPSPTDPLRDPRDPRPLSSSSSVLEQRGGGGEGSSSNPTASIRERRSRRSQSKRYPQGVSWFIAAEDHRLEDQKENRQQKGEGPAGGRGSAWFEAYSRTRPWREPLGQRQVQEDRTGRVQVVRSDPRLDPELLAKTTSSGLVRLSLQESLALRRPEFVSRSRERMQRLAMQAEERRLQSVFSRDGEQQLYRPQGPPWRAPGLTGSSRRAVPRKEMVLRSKLIYEKLPEVQRRREEARRQAEYRSYRLNAQLYNKRVTRRVLGRRVAWQ